MPSLIQGFEYDIFISYRQKDNKGDKWVSEFVNALKTELESTFKEEINVYFDINPQDGLLETHDVDASLKEKLKCLVFIPIISRTYCDPKSFAWEHELKAFVEQTSQDQFGLKIKLLNGNVAGRVLPVRIHDLDTSDIKECESLLGGVLRGIEFIYKEPGVNKPLTADDDEKRNLNNTRYRIQINKVANAVKEIITGLKNPELSGKGIPEKITKVKPPERITLGRRIIAYALLFLALTVAGYFIILKPGKPEDKHEKSIAVLPFKLLSDEPDKQYLADGMMDAITLHLSKIKDFRVMPRTSVEQYRGTTKTIRQIGKELDVAYLLEGSFQKYGENAKLIVQLIKASEESHVWGNEYNRNWKDIFSVQSEVTKTIVRELYASMTPEEKKRIEEIPTSNMTAYDLYLRANDYQKDFQETRDPSSYQTAVNLYNTALKIDSSFAKAYTGLASAYFNRYQWETYFKENYLDSMRILIDKALSIDDELNEAYYYKGQYYSQTGDNDKALENIDKALIFNPNNYLAYQSRGDIYSRVLGDYVNGLRNYHKALTLVRGTERPALLGSLGGRYMEIGFTDKAKYYYQEAFEQDSNKSLHFRRLAWIAFSLENFEETLKLVKQGCETDSLSCINTELMFFNVPSGHKEEAYLFAKKKNEQYKRTGTIALQTAFQIGYAFWQVGQYQEAKNFFNQQIKYDEESIRLRRAISQVGNAQYDLASTYAFLGEKEKAYKYLEEFVSTYFPKLWQISYAKHNPFMKRINNEERYKKLLQNMEVKYQAENERVRKWLEEEGML